MGKCPNCGNETTGNFCEKCGTKVDNTQMNNNITNTINCPNCGGQNNENSAFCSKCGFKLNNDISTNSRETKFCINCGEKIDINAEICPKCGVRVQNTTKEKNPTLAAILSFLVIGLGQVYNGQIKKGILLFIGAIISGILFLIFIGIILWFILWIYGMFDAYKSAEEINSGMILEDKIDFDNLLHKK